MVMGFGVLAVLVTWPLATNFGTDIAGGGTGGDASGYVWDFWYNAEHGLVLWGVSTHEIVSAPFGRVLPGSANATLLVTLGPAWVVTNLASPIAAYNVAALGGLALSGAAMYLLVRWLGLGVAPAIWAGLSFTLFPYELFRSAGHVPLAHLECFPLMLMASIHWAGRPSIRRALLLSAAVAFGWLTNPYYGLMCTIIAAVAVTVTAGAAWRRAGFREAARRAVEPAIALFVLVGLPLLALQASSREAADLAFRRDSFELEIYGARLTDYVRPAVSNPLWSDILGDPFASPMGERTNYLGAVTIVLALVGLAAALRWRAELSSRARIAAGIGVPTAAILIWFSLASPTRWFGVAIDMPSALIFEFTPFLRAFARFAPGVMAVAVALGAIGLWWLVRRRDQVGKLSIIVAILLTTVIELPVSLPIGSGQPAPVVGRAPADVPTWAWLREHDRDALVFELPGRADVPIERYYMYGQLEHGHRILNGNLLPGQLGYDVVNQVGLSTWPNTARWLSALGVDLVTINPWAYARAGLPSPDPRRPPPGFAVTEAFPDGSAVWRVTAAAAAAMPVFRRQGWWVQEFRSDGRIWRWMDDQGHITVVAAQPGIYRMSFRVRPLDPATPVPLQITGPDGAITRAVVRGEEQALDVTVRLTQSRGEVVIGNLGPPARQPSPLDTRLVSVMVSEPVLTRIGGS